LVYKLHNTVAVRQVMNGDCLGEHIFSDAAHLNAVRREEATSIHEAAAFKDHWIVAFIHDQHSNQTFISVYYEIATEFMHVFLFAGELLLTKASEITELGADHNWDVTQTDCYFFFRLIIDFPADSRVQGGLVSNAS